MCLYIPFLTLEDSGSQFFLALDPILTSQISDDPGDDIFFLNIELGLDHVIYTANTEYVMFSRELKKLSLVRVT